MEIRLKIPELTLVILGLFSSGAMLGIAMADNFQGTDAHFYSAGALIVSLTLIVRKRYKIIS